MQPRPLDTRYAGSGNLPETQHQSYLIGGNFVDAAGDKNNHHHNHHQLQYLETDAQGIGQRSIAGVFRYVGCFLAGMMMAVMSMIVIIVFGRVRGRVPAG